MSLVWVLFGTECDYYRGLRKVYTALELKEVNALKAKFSPENCRRITWAILDDGQAFFNDVKTMLDFQGPEGVVYPQSYLIDILSSIRYATLVERASFPDEWKQRNQMCKEQGGRATGGIMGGGQRTGEGLPARGSYNQGLGGNQKRDYQGSIQYQGTGQGGQGGGTNGGQGFSRYGGQQTGGNQ